MVEEVNDPLRNAEVVGKMLEGLGSRDPLPAWSDFLQVYSRILVQVIHLFERDPDHVSDCFVFVCEHLSEKGFRRLRQFRPNGQALFTTWLRAVVRNLCVDWQRKEFGRERVFQSVAKLSQLDQDVFSSMFVKSMSSEDCISALARKHAGISTSQVEESVQRIRSSLSSRQIWLLESRRPRFESLEDNNPSSEVSAPRQIPDPAPGIEQTLADEQLRRALDLALERLPVHDRLMVKLRYSQGLTLKEVATALGLKDAQTADRQLREILERLRMDLSDFA